MDDGELLVRLKRLDEARFEQILTATLGEARADIPPPTAERSARAARFVELLRGAPRVRERVVTMLGGDDPVGAWVAWGLRRYREVPVLGFRGQVTLPLDDVFVQLQVAAGVASPLDHRHRMEAHALLNVTPAEALVLAGERKMAGVVLLGDPGSGKTTLLQHLYTRVASGDAACVGMPPDTRPVLVRFASITPEERRDGGLREVVYAEARRNGHPAAAEALRGERRPWLVLLDGLDEVRDEETRVETCRWLDGEVHHLPDARFVVTCRYAAWQREARLNARFLPVDVLLLDDARVRDYVGRWFRAVALGLRGVAPRPESELLAGAGARAERLLSVLLSRERAAQLRLRDLTANPLLLSTLCLVFHDDRDLPEQRSELYDRCIKLLLEQWTERRHGRPALPDRPTRQVLQPVAWAMHEAQRIDATAEEIDALVAQAIARVPGFPLDATALLERARDDCGILASRDVGTFRFFHLTFQEYLAACHAQRQRLERALADRAGDPRWQEVILLAVARGGLFEPFVRELVARDAVAAHHELLRECLLDADAWDEAPFVAALDRVLERQGEVLAWAKRPWWRRVVDDATKAPVLTDTMRASALATLTLLHGRPLPGVRARAEQLAESDDAALRDAARRFLGRSDADAASELREPLTGMVFRWVPPGEFLMGSSKTPGAPGFDPEAYDNELPAHRVTLTQGYHLGQHPVTNAAYTAFTQATRWDAAPLMDNRRFNDPAQPVVGVTFEDAMAFCAWLTATSPLATKGHRFDLPTEAEREFAARGSDGRRYPWSNEKPTAERAVWGLDYASGATSLVGQHGASRSPFGCEDMAGNVWEWCLDAWRDNYGSDAPAVDPCHIDGDANVTRVVRGGSWDILARYFRCASRLERHSWSKLRNLGFRVVVRGSRQPR